VELGPAVAKGHDDRILIVNAMTETKQKGQAATVDYLWSVAEEFKLHFPQLLDTNKDFYKYANSTSISLPFHVGIDLRTMKVVYTGSGKKTLSTVEAEAAKILD
jgi:hypothetical protein